MGNADGKLSPRTSHPELLTQNFPVSYEASQRVITFKNNIERAQILVNLSLLMTVPLPDVIRCRKIAAFRQFTRTL